MQKVNISLEHSIEDDRRTWYFPFYIYIIDFSRYPLPHSDKRYQSPK